MSGGDGWFSVQGGNSNFSQKGPHPVWMTDPLKVSQPETPLLPRFSKTRYIRLCIVFLRCCPGNTLEQWLLCRVIFHCALDDLGTYSYLSCMAVRGFPPETTNILGIREDPFLRGYVTVQLTVFLV